MILKLQGRTQGVLCIQKIPKRNDRKNKNTVLVGDSIVRGGNLYFMTCALVINILVHIRDTLSLGPNCGVYKGHSAVPVFRKHINDLLKVYWHVAENRHDTQGA